MNRKFAGFCVRAEGVWGGGGRLNALRGM